MMWRFVWESLLVTVIFACGGPVPVAAQALEPIAANDNRNTSTLFALSLPVSAQQAVGWEDPSPHTTKLVTVEDGVQLEVLDWGGSGRSIVLLAGLGDTAHVFDGFAPMLAELYRVYGITGRGFGGSSAPSFGYDFSRLAEDVIRVYAVPASAGDLMRPWCDANDPVVRENVETLYVLARHRFMRHSRWFEAFAENSEIVGISGEHHLFLTNAADVLREMQSFVSSLR